MNRFNWKYGSLVMFQKKVMGINSFFTLLVSYQDFVVLK